MKKNGLYALAALLIGGLAFVSCTGSSAPATSLKNSVDSLSYACGVNVVNEVGLLQYLEQSGVLESASNIDYEYQMKIAVADSTQKTALEKEYKAKLDSVNKINAPKLDGFIKGLKKAFATSGEGNESYLQGLGVGQQISKGMLPQITSVIFGNDSTKKVNTNQFLAGLIGSLKNGKLAIEKTDANELVQTAATAAQEAAQKKQEEELKVQYKDSIAASEAFLAENAKRPGVTVTESGLQYEILKKGNGPIPTDTDQVEVDYHGTLLNGTVFDSSVKSGQPATFGVTQVIKGWTEALKLMPVGSKWKLYIPYDLAYGTQDGGLIKPFSTLVFEVELKSIVKK
ncbi:MAG: FKBP-type peptidyl-prolyl cis-trans isomerase [Dysgonamonadaceae bacterium]|jgi:FKBP-type peptidyl-prolyl cis-trans isomerase FklB|nr:FKBP-type peptidyl-prolyl cis-trans isomerase [Dysgonamonadaceae bacterium]